MGRLFTVVFVVLLLVFIVACTAGNRWPDPSTFDPYPAEIDDYSFLIGAKPVNRILKFSTCPNWDPYGKPFTGVCHSGPGSPHHSFTGGEPTTEMVFDFEDGLVVKTGDYSIWRPSLKGDPQPYPIYTGFLGSERWDYMAPFIPAGVEDIPKFLGSHPEYFPENVYDDVCHNAYFELDFLPDGEEFEVHRYLRKEVDEVNRYPFEDRPAFESSALYVRDASYDYSAVPWVRNNSMLYGGYRCYRIFMMSYLLGGAHETIRLKSREGVVALGRISDLVEDSVGDNAGFVLNKWINEDSDIEIVSGKKVLVGLAINEPQSDTEIGAREAGAFNRVVYACLDEDENGVCDSEDGEWCTSQGGDYYDGKCCGAAGTSQCYYDDEVHAYCGETAAGPRWIPVNDWIGDIVPLEGQCGKANVVSNGSYYLMCNKSREDIVGIPWGSVRIQDNSVVSIFDPKFGESHDYVCSDGQWFECGGDASFSSTQSAETGDTEIFDDDTWYCTEGFSWTQSLDGFEDACVDAGLEWTGTMCCGEPSDPLKTYQENLSVDSLGGCYNSTFIASGSMLSGNSSVANYHGVFVLCGHGSPVLLSQLGSPAGPFTSINPYSYITCGPPLLDAKTSGWKRNLVCDPSNEWRLTEYNETTLAKSVVWTTIEPEEGCCGEQQCWTGAECVDAGEYYRSPDNRGFRCVENYPLLV